MKDGFLFSFRTRFPALPLVPLCSLQWGLRVGALFLTLPPTSEEAEGRRRDAPFGGGVTAAAVKKMNFEASVAR